MLSKKYFSISEAAYMSMLATHKLRYIDKVDKNISIVKIRGRRYYTMENIEYLISKYSNIDHPITNKTIQEPINTPPNRQETPIDYQFIARIDQLLSNFYNLAKDLRRNSIN